MFPRARKYLQKLLVLGVFLNVFAERFKSIKDTRTEDGHQLSHVISEGHLSRIIDLEDSNIIKVFLVYSSKLNQAKWTS